MWQQRYVDMAAVRRITRLGMFAVAATIALWSSHGKARPAARTSPIYGVSVPEGYRKWELIAPARESAPLNELRTVLGNAKAIDAYTRGTLPFPNGTILPPPSSTRRPFPAGCVRLLNPPQRHHAAKCQRECAARDDDQSGQRELLVPDDDWFDCQREFQE